MCLPYCDIDNDGDDDSCLLCIPLMCILGYCCCKKCGNKTRENDYLPPGNNYPPGGPPQYPQGPAFPPSGYPGAYPASGYPAGPQYPGYAGGPQQGYPQYGNDGNYPGQQPGSYSGQQPGGYPMGYPNQQQPSQAYYPSQPQAGGYPQNDFKQQPGSSIVNFVQ